MNWTDKAQEIAVEIIGKMGGEKELSKEKFAEGLIKAALRGMAFECDNWINKEK